MMTTVKTQEFLKSGKTLQNLYQRYDIQHFINHELGIVVFNYRPLSPRSSPIVRECRGLILEMDTWEIVCKPIEAFFEPSESGYKAVFDKFDWSSAKALNKIDGALVCLYYYKGSWQCSTRYSAAGDAIVNSPNSSGRNVTWRQLVEETLAASGTNWDEYTSKLDKDIFYVFELVTPDNRVVVLYAKSHLYLVAAVKRNTLEEIDIFATPFHGELASYQKVNKLSDVYAMIDAQPDAYKNEGYVVVDKNFNRLKIRNPRYAEAMRAYSIDDELSALRELRMLDVAGFTIITGTGTPSATSSVTAVDTGMGPSEFLGAMSTPPGLRNVLNRLLYLAEFVSKTYEDSLTSNADLEQSSAYQIWPQAFQGMKEGKSISDIMDLSPDHELMAALRRYETQFAGQNLTGGEPIN